MTNIRPSSHVCVYCGSGLGKNPSYVKAAHVLAKALARARIGLVYGGGGVGLMGELARATLDAKGYVTGIIPEFLSAREQVLSEVQERIVTKDMHERKMEMFNRASGFIALPGGFGTLEELIEVSTWRQLGVHKKPVLIANIDGYWTPLLALIDRMREERFIREGLEVDLHVVDRAEDLVPHFLRMKER